MAKKPTIYLCGKMSGLSWDEMNGWRLQAAEMLGDDFYVFNPCSFYNFEILKKLPKEKHNTFEREAKEFDLHVVRMSDLVLVNFDYADSIGSAIEIHVAHDTLNKPVIAFGGKDKGVHPWMQASVSAWRNDLEDAINYIYRYWYPVLSGQTI